jgi:uncharacterized lipoprotein YmbA
MPVSITRGSLAGLMMLLLNACVSPRERYYLLEQSAPERSIAIAKRSTVLVGPVVIPAEIDRPQIVVRKGPDEVAFNEQERWAVPLKEALPRMIAGELSRRGKNTRFVPIGSGVASTAKAQLAIDFIRFEASYEAGATVALHWVYRASAMNLTPLEGDVVARSPVETQSIEGLLEALRRATTETADAMANLLPDDS